MPLCCALLLTGCATQLRPEDGYPADWPGPVALTKDCKELVGTYANQGMTAGSRSVRLETLIPKDKELGEAPAPPRGSARDDSVSLAWVPTRENERWYHRGPWLQATIRTNGVARTYRVRDAYAFSSSVQYLLSPGPDDNATHYEDDTTVVFLTTADDGSLIAKIRSESGLLLPLGIPIPMFSTSYVWARFERIPD
jgi:hypothetical protein